MENERLIDETEEITIIKNIKINANWTKTNFIIYLLNIFFSIAFIVYLNAAQVQYLTSVLEIKTGLGKTIGILAMVDEFLAIIMTNLWALWSDIVGRRKIFSIGFVLISLSLFSFTFTNGIWTLVMVRIVFSLGASACSSMLAAALCDCSGKESGKVAGIVGATAGLGAVFSLMFFLNLPSRLESFFNVNTSIIISFYIVSLFSFLWSFINWGLYSKKMPTREYENMEFRDLVKNLKERWLEALKLGWENTEIGLGYISGLVARGDTIILTTFIVLWTNIYFIEKGLCKPVTGSIKEDCREAYKIGSMLSGSAQTISLVFAPLFGILLDKLNKKIILFISSFIAIIGYLFFGLTLNPLNKINYLFVCFIGVGEIGTIVTSLALLSKNPNIDIDNRGGVSGVYSFFGSLGIIFSSRLGGYLFDSVSYGSPFVLMAGLHTLICFSAFIRFFKI